MGKEDSTNNVERKVRYVGHWRGRMEGGSPLGEVRVGLGIDGSIGRSDGWSDGWREMDERRKEGRRGVWISPIIYSVDSWAVRGTRVEPAYALEALSNFSVIQAGKQSKGHAIFYKSS